jgi:hypothetical protein
MKYRKLRITWSVAWGIVAVLLCVLWVRSYWWTDSIEYVESFVSTTVESSLGITSFRRFHSDLAILGPNYWRVDAALVTASDDEFDSAFKFRWKDFDSDIWVTMPTWLIVSLTAVLASLPWLPLKRFSLRTLLIKTTLVAVVLGLIVWTLR